MSKKVKNTCTKLWKYTMQYVTINTNN